MHKEYIFRGNTKKRLVSGSVYIGSCGISREPRSKTMHSFISYCASQGVLWRSTVTSNRTRRNQQQKQSRERRPCNKSVGLSRRRTPNNIGVLLVTEIHARCPVARDWVEDLSTSFVVPRDTPRLFSCRIHIRTRQRQWWWRGCYEPLLKRDGDVSNYVDLVVGRKIPRGRLQACESKRD